MDDTRVKDADFNRQLAEALAIEPLIEWHALTADETATAMPFESKREGEEWFADKKRRFPEGSRYDEYHLGTWKRYPDFSKPEIFWPAFEKWLSEPPNGSVNGLYAKYEVFVDGSGSMRILDFNTDKTWGFAETNPDPIKRVTLADARCRAWLSALKLTTKGGV